MLRLRLFRRDDPTSQLDSRTLDEGQVSIGRDAKADWRIDDPERAISRNHLVIVVRGGLVTVRDTSSNGVFLGTPRQRIERDKPVPVGRGEPIQFGNYMLVVEEEQRSAPPPAPAEAQSPFGEIDEPAPLVKAPRGRQPFASTLKADPLEQGGDVGDRDAWERPAPPQAGSWDAAGAHRKPDHSALIGSDRTWREPPPPPAQEASYGFDAPFSQPILEQPRLSPSAAAIPSNWMDEPSDASRPAEQPPEPVQRPEPQPERIALSEPITPHQPVPAASNPDVAAMAPPVAPPPIAAAPGDDSLFDHFCAGAGLNPHAFAGEDRAAVMERLGAVYRQAVLGIADLMQERTSLRNEYRMVHTTVRPQGNNPFKWVPPQRIAVELLRGDGSGYTTGDRALNDALHDLKAHLLCMLAGMRAALATTFKALSPEEVEERVAGRSYLMKTQRDAALWTEYVELAERLRAEADDSADGLINRAFRRAYEAQAAELDGSSEWR